MHASVILVRTTSTSIFLSMRSFHSPTGNLVFEHKKRPMFFHSPVYYIIKEAARQAITCRHSPPLLYYRYRFHLVQAGTRFCPRLVFHIIRTYNDAIKQSERFIHPLSPRLQRLSFLPHFHGCLWYPAPPFQAHRFLPHLPPGFR